MRFLHTADWHAGKLLRGRSRLDELEAIGAELLDLAGRERVDCLLFSGDLFDSQAPAPDAERLVYHFFAELVSRQIHAVVIAGNHDHPKRLSAIRQILEPLHLHIRAEPSRPAEGGVIQISRNGETAIIAALPFVAERKIVDIETMLGPEESRYSAYSDVVGRLARALCDSFSAATINLLVAHLYVHGAEVTGSERAIHISDPYAVSAAAFPVEAQYVALGHLHRPQKIDAAAPALYSGSPLQLDFGELGEEKRVVLIDAHPGRPAHIESIPLSSGRRLRDVAGTLHELARLHCGDDFLRVTVRTGGPDPGVAAQVRELLPNAVDIRSEYPRPDPVPVARAAALSPEELFAAFYRQRFETDASEEIAAAFRSLYEEASS